MKGHSAYIELQLARINTVAPGISIVQGDLGPVKSADPVSLSDDGSEFHFNIGNCVRFAVRRDLSQAVVSSPESRTDTLRQQIGIYSALATVLHAMRGDLTFHGNGLSFNQQSYAVLAGSGRGKSSLTLFALLNRHLLVGDDTVAIRADGQVTGGRPFLHLTAETVASLLAQHSHAEFKKHYLLSDLGLPPALPFGPPLSRIYLLEEGPSVELRPCDDLPRTIFALLNSSQIMAALVRFDPSIVDRLLKLAGETGVRRLIYPRSWASLPEVLENLEQDLSSC